MPPQRPELPLKYQNPHLKSLDSSKWPAVKYQSLDRDGHEVLVGRLKIPTPSGHAFILRRYDTGAISLTTMFRAAFPDASEVDERKETQWAKEAFDLSGNNGSGRDPHIVRLAGTWISPSLALSPQFADVYRLHSVIHHIAKAVPDPTASYRRSATKATPKAAPSPATLPAAPTPTPASASASAVPVSMGSPAKSLLTPAPSMTMPTPKRRRESSPAPSPAAPPSRNTLAPRRSMRTKSPVPPATPQSIKSPKPARSARAVRVAEVMATPAGSDETVVEEEETVALAKPSMTQDMAEQKELIARLKAERHAKTEASAPAPAPLKRERDEPEEDKGTLRFNFKEPETEARVVATNKRVSRFTLEPRNKSVAWGVAAFALGMGAVSFLPNFF